MQILETNVFCCNSIEDTKKIASNLLHCLYPEIQQTIIFLKGDVGVGKTTFAKAFFSALNIECRGSPTFSLIEEYSSNSLSFAHVDLYRLSQQEAKAFWQEQDVSANIVLIEWPERLDNILQPDIEIEIRGTDNRTVTITFHDEPIIHLNDLVEWAKTVALPEAIQLHCRLVGAVAHFAGCLAIQNNIPLRLQTVYQAGLLHDMYRFIDFHEKYAPKGIDASKVSNLVWEEIRQKHPHLSHGSAIAAELRSLKQNITAAIIEPHELWELPKTIEQRLVFYGDKRSIGNTFTTVTLRMQDLCTRYNDIAIKHDTELLRRSLLEFEVSIDPNLSRITNEMVEAHTKQHGLLPWDQLE